MVWKIVEGMVIGLIVAVSMAIVGLLGYLLLLAIPSVSLTPAIVWTTLLAPVLFVGLLVGALLLYARR